MSTQRISTTASKVEQFCDLVSQGINAWTLAGSLLCEIKQESPDVISEIVRLNPTLTKDVLDSFLAIGEKKLYPWLLMDTSPGAAALAGLPYEQQAEAYTEGVIVCHCNGKAFEKKPVRDLTQSDIRQVFKWNGIRTPEEQTEFLRTQRRTHEPGPGVKNNGQHSYGKLHIVTGEQSEAAKRGILVAKTFDASDRIKHIKLLMEELVPEHPSIAQFGKMLDFLSKFGDFIRGLNEKIAAQPEGETITGKPSQKGVIEGDFATPSLRSEDELGRPRTLIVLKAIERGPLTLHQISDATGLTVHEVDAALKALRNRLNAKVISGEGSNRLIGITKPGADAIVYHNRIIANKERRNPTPGNESAALEESIPSVFRALLCDGHHQHHWQRWGEGFRCCNCDVGSPVFPNEGDPIVIEPVPRNQST